MLVSMKLRIKYPRLLEDSGRVPEGLPGVPADFVSHFPSRTTGYCRGVARPDARFQDNLEVPPICIGNMPG